MATVPQPHAATVSYRCPSCSRCFVALGDVPAQDIVCSCGTKLVAQPFPRGLYALESSVSEEAAPTALERPAVPQEPDLGYGASHGYDAAHGGPSGPGDAPADVDEGTPPPGGHGTRSSSS